MKIVEKKIDEIIPYEKNPRLNDKAVDVLVNSIKEFGFKVPIIIDKDNVIVCGHTRLKAAKKLGLETVPCIVADDLTPEQIKAFRVADNKVSDYSIWDNKLLLEELNELGDIFTGFNTSDIFDDVLDETENNIIKKNDEGVFYNIYFKSQNKNLINLVKNFILENGGHIDE